MDAARLNLSPSLECQEVSAWQKRFPHLDQAQEQSIEVIQNAGEALFVPSGWTHTVENLEDTISINHNWLNGVNVMWSAHLLCRTFSKAIQLLCDCRYEHIWGAWRCICSYLYTSFLSNDIMQSCEHFVLISGHAMR